MQPPEEEVAPAPAGATAENTAAGRTTGGANSVGAGTATGMAAPAPGARNDRQEHEYNDEPVLKYQRMGADIGKLLSDENERETIVRMMVHDSSLVFGMSSGSVLVTDYHGNERHRFKPHTKAVTDLSMDMTGNFLASCSEDGSVVVTGLRTGQGGEQSPPEVYNYGAKWSMLAVKIDPQYARRKEKMFVAGGAAGKLLLLKKGWLGHDESVLHKGEGPVSAIAWRGPLVAWASDGGVKIIDVDKIGQGKGNGRISYITRPRSLLDFKEHPCRCHLLWETPTRLLIGWGDAVVVLQVLVREPRSQRAFPTSQQHQQQLQNHANLSPQNPGSAAAGNRRSSLPLTSPGGLPMAVIGAPSAVVPAVSEAPERHTAVLAVWQADCLICGLSSFDEDTLVLLGYPVLEIDEDSEEGEGEEGGGAVVFRSGGGLAGAGDGFQFQPEVQLVNRHNGKVVSADALPLPGWDTAGVGDFLLRSTCFSSSSHRQDKDGATFAFETCEAAMAVPVRGLPPAVFIMSPKSVVVARVRNVDDKVTWALERGDYLGAVNVALARRHLLRTHDFQDLVARYLEQLMDKGKFFQAAADCPRLLNGDSNAWERWVFGFAQRRHLADVVPYIPTKDPRLPASVYEAVLEHLLVREPRLFLETLRRWGHPRGKHGGQHGGRPSAGRIASGERGGGALGRVDSLSAQDSQQELYSLPVMMARMEASLVQRPDPLIMEAQAEAYVMDRQFASAIRAYLALAEAQAPGSNEVPGRESAWNSRGGGGDEVEGSGEDGGGGIENTKRRYEHVFNMIEQHSLVLLDTVKNRVLQLIRLDRDLTGELLLRHPEKIGVHSVVKQLEGRRDLQNWYLNLLFARSPEMYGAQEFAPLHVLQVSLLAEFAPPFERGRAPPYNSAFLQFLKGSGFAPLEAALKECGRRRPPLYDEMAYILGRMGDTRRALTILLEEVGSVPRAIEFVESHDKELWVQLIEHSLRNEAFLSGLLDHAGVYDVDLARLVAEIPKGMHVSGLRDKIVKIISDYHFQVRVNESCSKSVKSDLLRTLRRLNQGQRRALRVERGTRCNYGTCLMPLDGPPRGIGFGGGVLAQRTRVPHFSSRGGGASSKGGRGWGRGKGGRAGQDSVETGRGGSNRGVRGGGGVFVFPCGHKFHEFCLGVSTEGSRRSGVGSGDGGGLGSAPAVCSICSRSKGSRR